MDPLADRFCAFELALQINAGRPVSVSGCWAGHGNILDGAQDLVTVQSFIDYQNSSSGSNIGFNLDTLVYFDIAPLQPEQSGRWKPDTERPWERSCTWTPIITSLVHQFYRIQPGSGCLVPEPSFPDFITGVDVYRYAAV